MQSGTKDFARLTAAMAPSDVIAMGKGKSAKHAMDYDKRDISRGRFPVWESFPSDQARQEFGFT